MDKKKVIYTCYQPYQILLAEQLRKEINFEPVYFYSIPNVVQEIKTKFPEALVHDYFQAIKGVIPHECEHIPEIIIDETILKKMSFHETVAIQMMNRLDISGTMTYTDRWNLYIKQLAYWMGVLKYLEPDYVIMETAPHQNCDYILYALCQEFGYKVIMFCQTMYYDRIFAYDSLENGSTIIRNSYKNKIKDWKGEEISLTGVAKETLENNIGKYDPNLKPYIIPNLNSFTSIENTNYFQKIIFLIFTNIKRLFRYRSFLKLINVIRELKNPSPHSYQKQKLKVISESNMNNLEYNLAINKADNRKKQLLRYYKTICSQEINLNHPFVYFPLHYQPEESSSPLGGYYADQLLIIDILSKSIPSDWKIFVKEHFSQFVHSFSGEVTRSEDYYNKIVSYKNVELVPMNYHSFELIDKCICSATITGTVAFETVCRGKLSILFGHANIYKECEGMYYTPTKELVADFIKLVKDGNKPNINKLKIWLQTMEENTFRGGIGTEFNYGHSGIYKEENAEGHKKALLHLLKNDKSQPNYFNS